MRRLFLLTLAFLELFASLVLLSIAWLLPGSREVDHAVGKVAAVGRTTSQQFGVLRERLSVIRQRVPALRDTAERLHGQMRTVDDSLRDKSFQGDGLCVIGSGLEQLADGVEELALEVEESKLNEVRKGLLSTADYLDDRVAPGAEEMARALEQASKALREDANALAVLIKETPVELKAARTLVDSMARFEEGLDRATQIAQQDNFQAMHDGFKGMQTALESGAVQVDRLATFTVPRVTVKGLKLDVEEKSFWPDSDTVSDGMRKAAKGCAAAAQDLNLVGQELPRFRHSLMQSRRVVRLTRETLQAALNRQEKVEPILQKLPEQLAHLACDLPELALDLARMLRETVRLKEVATALRQVEKTVALLTARSPSWQQGLLDSVKVLRATKKHLHLAAQHGEEYEKLLRNTVALTTTFSEAIPPTLQDVDEGLEEQDASLEELQHQLDHAGAMLPGLAKTGWQLLLLLRLLALLFALIVGLHSGLMFVKSRDTRA